MPTTSIFVLLLCGKHINFTLYNAINKSLTQHQQQGKEKTEISVQVTDLWFNCF